MTCIVGLVERDKVWMGGDSAGVAGYSTSSRLDPKVFRNGPYLMGFTTSFRMGQILQFGKPPAPPARGLFRFMVTTFVPWAREAMKSAGYLKIKDNQEEGGTFLVGTRGRLFYVDSDFQIGEHHDNFAAVGCGQDLALGSLYSSERLTPRQRVVTALRAAERFSAGVRRPFRVLSLGGSALRA